MTNEEIVRHMIRSIQDCMNVVREEHLKEEMLNFMYNIKGRLVKHGYIVEHHNVKPCTNEICPEYDGEIESNCDKYPDSGLKACNEYIG